MKHPNRGGPRLRAQGDNYLERYIAHQRPAGTEPVTLAVDYLNELCDRVYGGRKHNYTLNHFGKWRRWLAGNRQRPGSEPPPRQVVDVIRAELLHIVLIEHGEDYASSVCDYVGLPALDAGSLDSDKLARKAGVEK